MAIEFIPGAVDTPAFKLTGNEQRLVRTLVPVRAANADGDVKIFAEVSAFAVLTAVAVTNTAIASGTAYKIGLYKRVSKPAGDTDTTEVPNFVEIDDDVISGGSALDLSSARAEGSAVSGMAGITVANRLKKIYELAADTITSKQQSYFLGLKGATIGSADGSVGIDVSYINAVQ